MSNAKLYSTLVASLTHCATHLYTHGFHVIIAVLLVAPFALSQSAGSERINPADGQVYVWIQPGTFQMGCSVESDCRDDENPRHQVTLTHGFWLGQTEVTQAAYERVSGAQANISVFRGLDRPVENVSWDRAARYCSAIGGRLATEAEWEYAARAGSTGPEYGQLNAIAWWEGNSGPGVYRGQTHPVGQKEPNAWKLYDMLGNVSEWVSDYYDASYYKTSPPIDPPGPDPVAAPGGPSRVTRGGDWYSALGRAVNASHRGYNWPNFHDRTIGFRCVWQTQ